MPKDKSNAKTYNTSTVKQPFPMKAKFLSAIYFPS